MSARSPLAVALLLFACRNDKVLDAAPAAEEELNVLTYNVGLAVGFVPGAESRAPLAAEKVAAEDADLVCLQEVWWPEHVAMFEQAATTSFPETYFPEPSQEVLSEPACEPGEIDPLITCIEEKCSDVACTDELVDCLFEECPYDFLLLGKSCMECVQANVGGTAAEVADTCNTEHTKYAYDGSFGTGLMSPWPIGAVEEHVFESTTNRRSVLHAVVDAPSGQFDAYCTHLTAVFDLVPYPRETGSWAEEQAAQMTDLLSYVDSSKQTENVVLMGDMNAGPEVGDSAAEVEENWAILAASGMRVPYVENEGPCTFCPDNPLQGADSDEDGVVIDHVLADGFDGWLRAERVLTEKVDVEVCGEVVSGAYSDHYGVRVSLY